MARVRPGKTAKRNRQAAVLKSLCHNRDYIERNTLEEYRSSQRKAELQRIKIEIANLKAKGLVE